MRQEYLQPRTSIPLGKNEWSIFGKFEPENKSSVDHSDDDESAPREVAQSLLGIDVSRSRVNDPDD